MIFEMRRQFIHLLFGSIFIALLVLLGSEATFEILLACLLAGITISLAIKHGIKIPVFSKIVEKVEREHEKEWPGQGAIFFFLAAIIILFFFRNPLIAIGALCALIFGDSASTIIGIKFGKHRLAGKRTLEGTIAGILASLPFLAVLFPLPIAIATVIIAMLAELLPINDNFTIPIAAAITLTILTTVL
ncbi:MAG: hypothetical protein PHD95_01925 [Candidatus ainarchaeum sp.]|nr:hypothetical protein [Candidatus ainarchaeum sp.]